MTATATRVPGPNPVPNYFAHVDGLRAVADRDLRTRRQDPGGLQQHRDLAWLQVKRFSPVVHRFLVLRLIPAVKDNLDRPTAACRDGRRLMSKLASHHYLLLVGHHRVDIEFLGQVFGLTVEEI